MVSEVGSQSFISCIKVRKIENIMKKSKIKVICDPRFGSVSQLFAFLSVCCNYTG